MIGKEDVLAWRGVSLPKRRGNRIGAVVRNGGRRAKMRAAVGPIMFLTERPQDSRPVTATWFHYFDPGAKEVFLVGDFNRWTRGATPMLLGAGGDWCAELQLPPGVYEYRLIVDGVWKDDPKAAETRANAFGGRNAVRVVPAAL